MNYPRPERDSGIMIHCSPNGEMPIGDWPVIEPMADLLVQMGFSWVMLVLSPHYTKDRQIATVKALLNRGIEVVCRLYIDKPYPDAGNRSELAAAVRELSALGVHYFQIRNEGNLECEWQEGQWAARSYDQRVTAVASVELADARMVLDNGGIPVLAPLSPGGNDDDERMFRDICIWWRANGGEATLSQCVLGVHNYTLNHPVDYPYDPINRRDFPTATILSGYGFSNGFLKFQFVHDVFQQVLGFEIPVLSTEGGTKPGESQDARYPTITPALHAQYNLGQAAYMSTRAPDWYLAGSAFWLLGTDVLGAPASAWAQDSWLQPGGNLPVVQAFKNRGFVERNSVIPTVVWSNPQLEQYRPLFQESAEQHNLDPRWLATIAWIETGGTMKIDLIADSDYHEVGLMQVVPGEVITGRPFTAQLLDPATNIEWGARILEDSISYFPGDLRRGLMGYNWGVNAVRTRPLASDTPVGYIAKFEAAWAILWPGVVSPVNAAITEETIRNAAWNHLYPAGGIPMNPASAFYRAARNNALGLPVTLEFDIGTMRFQGFIGGILCARIGSWDFVDLLTW